MGNLWVDYFNVCIGTPYDYDDAELLRVSILELKTLGANLQHNGKVFSATVPSRINKITVDARAQSQFAKVSLNNEIVIDDSTIVVELEEGENAIPIVVTVESGKQEEYILLNNRVESTTEAYLTALSLDDLVIEPNFNYNVYEYDAGITNKKSVILDYTAASETCTVEVKLNDVPITNNKLILDEGNNLIEIMVILFDGTNFATYTINVVLELEDELEINKKVESVIKMIAALPSVADLTLDDKPVIQEARTLYEALTDEQKRLVTNLDKLNCSIN